ncbi:hypothetical protein DH2020_012653 [Rehmannia glutinosa]|uniref:Homeobox-leucine zipper protein n=1 Tax=Rehmannia glutinosa TaxID=99300 RepID=A0ABR0X365_REHGL
MSYSGLDRAEKFQPDDDTSDDGCQILGEKKRRLNMEQVKTLEKSFELGNKLEPDRKMQLARALGLQPRQIAIWFQNRRARWKAKQLEKDYDVLKRQFESVKAHNDALKSQNKKLHSQLMALKSRESTGSDENSCHVNLNETSTDSKIYHHPNNKNAVVYTSSLIGPQSAAGLTEFLQSSSKSDNFQGQNIDNPNEPLCNMFTGMEENQDFWAWHGQQNFQ